jgi:hypothetical protein
MINSAAKTFRKSIKKSGVAFFKGRLALTLISSSGADYFFDFDSVLPINEANNGLLLASSFLDFATSSAAPGLGILVAFFMRCAVAKARFL